MSVSVPLELDTSVSVVDSSLSSPCSCSSGDSAGAARNVKFSSRLESSAASALDRSGSCMSESSSVDKR